jgi:putative hemolysin
MMEIFVIIVCLILNAILAGSETAFIAASRPSLKELAKKGDESAKLLLLLRENPERTLSVIQIGITFVGILAAALGGAGAEEVIVPWMASRFGISETLAEILSILIVVVPLTYVSVVIGELVPKSIALRRPLFLASKAAPWLHAISHSLDPIVTAFEQSTKAIVNLFPKAQSTREETPQSEISAEIGILSPKNKQYVINLLKIETTTVEKVMIEWTEVAYVESNQPIEQIEILIISSGHTRLPVVKDGEVIGIINTKEFSAFQKTGRLDWLSILRPALKISDTTFMLSALQLMQERRAHMAIVYRGSTKIGIVTMESIFEEIIGDIYDEDDDGTLKRILDSLHFKKR